MHEFKDVGLISDPNSRENSKPTTPIRFQNENRITPNKDTSPYLGNKIMTPNEQRENGMSGGRPGSMQPESVRFNSNVDEFKGFIDMDYSDM